MNNRWPNTAMLVCAPAILMAIASCSAPLGIESSASDVSKARSSTAARDSPTEEFKSAFPNRRNGGNDGTPYEPCVSLSTKAASDLGIDHSSGTDAAAVDGQTARGCTWQLATDKIWSFSQVVGNSANLAHYRSTQSGTKWRADVVLGGRTVAVGELTTGVCSTHVESGEAIVTTIAQYISLPTPPIDEICNRAIAFTKATINKMPP